MVRVPVPWQSSKALKILNMASTVLYFSKTIVIVKQLMNAEITIKIKRNNYVQKYARTAQALNGA